MEFPSGFVFPKTVNNLVRSCILEMFGNRSGVFERVRLQVFTAASMKMAVF
jgi:hypothetical protein